MDKIVFVEFIRYSFKYHTKYLIHILKDGWFVAMWKFKSSCFETVLGWGAVSDLSLILDLSQKFKHGLWRLKSKLKLSQKQHLTPGVLIEIALNFMPADALVSRLTRPSASSFAAYM